MIVIEACETKNYLNRSCPKANYQAYRRGYRCSKRLVGNFNPQFFFSIPTNESEKISFYYGWNRFRQGFKI